MTVKQLIAKLKTMPQNAKVYIADHDHHDFEVNGPLSGVAQVDYAGFDEAKEEYNLDEVFRIKGVIVKLMV